MLTSALARAWTYGCIVAVRRHTFANLDNFYRLDLKFNNITTLENEAFFNLPKLYILSLYSNHLVEIRSAMFRGIDNLNSLDLQYNRIERLDANFLQLSKLFDLFLTHNNISSIDKDAFKSLGNLQYLYLGDNPLFQIGAGAFHRLPRLTGIFMNKVNVTTLSRDILPNSTSLEQVFLFDSRVQFVEEGAFDGFGNVKYLYMQQNPIYDLPSGIFDALRSEHLHLLVLNCDVSRLPAISSTLSNRTQCASSSKIVNITAWNDGNTDIVSILRESAYNCSKTSEDEDHQLIKYTCSPCPPGYYGRTFTTRGYKFDDRPVCNRCPAGGFYQDEVAQYTCKVCVNGTFVSPNILGNSSRSCKVFPTGTDTTRLAGYRAGPCLKNYFRLQRFGACYPCKSPGAKCTNEVLTLTEGYWWTMEDDLRLSYRNFASNIFVHDDSYDRSTVNYSKSYLPTIHKCRYPNACQGQDNNPKKNVCSKGSYGPLCELCEKGYFLSDSGCSPCPPTWRVGLQLTGFVVVVLFLVVFLSWKQSKIEQNVQTGTWLDHFVSSLRIGIGFIQVMNGITMALVFVPWPSGIKVVGRYLRAIEFNVISVVNSVCLGGSLKHFDHLDKTLVFFGSVTGIVLMLVAIYWIWKVYMKCRRMMIDDVLHETALKFCLTGMLWTFFACYPSLSQYIIATVPYREFSCIALNCTNENGTTDTTGGDDNLTCQWYLKADVSLRCNESSFSDPRWRACNCLLIVVFGLPLLLLVLLYLKHRNDCHRVRVNSALLRALYSSLSFLDDSYESNYWYWDVVEMVRKLVLTSGLQFFGTGSTTQLAVASIIASAFALLHAQFKPIKSKRKWQHYLQLLSLSVISLNIMVGVLQLVDVGEEGNLDEEAMKSGIVNRTLFSVLFYSVNGLFVFVCVVNLCKSVWSACDKWCCYGLRFSSCCNCRRSNRERQPILSTEVTSSDEKTED
ncbi:uncharacterized protein LOC134192555 [Corticium candelabrum]|uniref:uncharacterized protein LOC134192555 n=1 Tax=Corticium candelabrum TaxID=121492 RepID=UPI002E260B45|nr:uncharacterized protein LOC134192555 [Corticium candelabrum]